MLVVQRRLLVGEMQVTGKTDFLPHGRAPAREGFRTETAELMRARFNLVMVYTSALVTMALVVDLLVAPGAVAVAARLRLSLALIAIGLILLNRRVRLSATTLDLLAAGLSVCHALILTTLVLLTGDPAPYVLGIHQNVVFLAAVLPWQPWKLVATSAAMALAFFPLPLMAGVYAGGRAFTTGLAGFTFSVIIALLVLAILNHLRRKEFRRRHELQTLSDRLSELVVRDGLTGLYNFRHFWDSLQVEVARSRRLNHSLALLILDLDNFKQFNDRYGHLHGDEVLRTVAEALQQAVRETDLVFRQGGDEFAVLLPGATLAAADGVALRASKAVEKALAKSDLPAAGALSISIGVALFPYQAGTIQELVEKADQDLYKAKLARRQTLAPGEKGNVPADRHPSNSL